MRQTFKLSAAFGVSVLALALGTSVARAADDPSAEIVVTAQKRTEKMQDIPVAVSVLSSKALQDQHVTDISDINKVVPSVEIKGTFNGRVPYGMRGISTNANEGAIGLTSGVNVEIDGVPVPADSFAANTLSDVAQLEVLKGPQATLGGRTASAGTINFVTNGPTNILKASATGMVTNDKEWRIDAAVSGPIANGLSFSLAGYIGKTTYPIYNYVQKFNSSADSGSIRGKLKYESGNFDMLLTGHYALMKSHGDNFVMQYMTPGATVFPFVFAPAVQPSATYPYPIYYGNTTVGSPVNMRSRYQDADGSVVLNYHLGGTTLSSTTTYFRENQFQNQDIFLSNLYFWNASFAGLRGFLTSIGVPAAAQPNPPTFDNLQSANGKVKQWRQEFKVATDASQPISGLAGLYYADTQVQVHGYNGWVGNQQGKLNISDTKSYAIYGRVTAKLDEQFSVIAGLRYNWDKLSWNNTELPINFATGDVYGTGPGTAPGDGGYLIMSPTCNPGTGCQWILHDSSGTLVGDVSLQYHPGKDAMLYASYTRGYKPRAYNTAHDWQSPQANPAASDALFLTPTEKERINSFEVGLKSSLLDHRLTFNAAAFYTRYSGYQAQIFDNTKLQGILLLKNADARTAGVEIETNYRAGNTSIGVSAAYIDARFTNFPGAQCYPTQTVAQGCVGGAQSLSGHSLPDSPKFKLNANVQQVVPLGNVNLLLGGNLSYRGDTMLQANGNPQTMQPGFALLDLSVGVQTKDQRITATFFVNNVTDHFYVTNAEDFFSGAFGPASGAAGAANVVIGQPARDAQRYFGGRISFKY
ncbi:MAG: TonB-dependent receptor [Sphingomonadales bacterium]|nr:TonB-dependent receptor [Sphingomonadales bacterium]